ncbi:MAG: HXXEE domain-containing protein [Alphaproteobacteria bacterium]|nr:MAG: HXXEE domain-containing protein [Alphaproteobacteria bacterium]
MHPCCLPHSCRFYTIRYIYRQMHICRSWAKAWKVGKGAEMAKFFGVWVYGGVLAALALMVSAVGLAFYLPLPLLLVFLLMPGYMVHQAEEHFDDRFRHFIDAEIGKGRPVLSDRDIFFVNVPGVWGVFALCFALACTVNVGSGLVPAYAALVNVPAHVAPALRMGRINPGLVTAVVVLLPLSVWTIVSVGSEAGVSWHWHAGAIAVAVLTHAGIFGLAALRVRANRI